MESIDCTYRSQTSIPTEATTVFVSLELSRARWLVTSLSPNTSKISRHFVPGGDAAELLRLLSELRAKAERHVNAAVKITCIQEIGFDGFWIHRVLAANGIESHVVEAASIAVPRRHRRAKTDTIDGELLLRTLMAFKRGEPRVCAMVVVPTPEEEDRRRLSRERKTMVKERIEHINRIKGLMACQGIVGFEPRRAKARERLDELRTGDGRPIPGRMKAEIRRELERLELLRKQIAEIEAERDALSPVEAAKAVTRCSALEASRHRTRVCVSALAGGALPSFCKPAPVGGLCGLGPQPLEKRRFEQRAGDLQIWKRAIADHDD